MNSLSHFTPWERHESISYPPICGLNRIVDFEKDDSDFETVKRQWENIPLSFPKCHGNLQILTKKEDVESYDRVRSEVM